MRDTPVVDALEAVERYARAFDEISSETDAHYSARAFVRWVRLEVTVLRDYKRHDAEGRELTGEAA